MYERPLDEMAQDSRARPSPPLLSILLSILLSFLSFGTLSPSYPIPRQHSMPGSAKSHLSTFAFSILSVTDGVTKTGPSQHSF